MNRRRPRAPDSAAQHRDWLSLIEVSGPFLSLPVLRSIWPGLDPLETADREQLRLNHLIWQDDTAAGQHAWISYVLTELLGWGDALRWNTDGALDGLSLDVGEHDTQLSPAFALVTPGEDPKPKTTEILGLVSDVAPTSRIEGEKWSATPVDRLARLCRHHEVELGLVTNGRLWTLVRAPRGKVTTTATFDAIAWGEAAELVVVRAFVSLLCRTRFFGVPDEEKLAALLAVSEDQQEEITEALGVQVRQAVELLVAAFGRADTAARERGERDLQEVSAHDIYRGAVSVMMRIVFLLFAEERKLLPSDQELYVEAYSVGGLSRTLEDEAREGSEDDLEHSTRRWQRLLALFRAVYYGVEHPRLTMHAHDGSLFDPDQFGWLPLNVDDRTVLHMLRAVQFVQIGTGKSRERRQLSFRELDVEQIGYVYEGLLSYDCQRAGDVVVGLIGKDGLEDEVELRTLEALRTEYGDTPTLAARLAADHKDSRIGSASALEKKLAPLNTAEREEARRKLLAVTGGDYELSERLLPFYRIIRPDLRELPVVVMPGELFVTESPLRKNTGTHYTPKELAEQIVEGALEPLVFSPGPMQTGDRNQWKPKASEEILSLNVADIAMGSAAFLVAAARYLGAKLIDAWARENDERAVGLGTAEVQSEDEDPVVINARRHIIEHCLYGVDINEMAVEMAKLSLWLVSMDPKRPFTFLDDRLVVGDSLLGITSLDQVEYLHLDPRKGRKIHEGAIVDETVGVRALVAEVAGDRRRLAEIDGSTLAGLGEKRVLLAESTEKTRRAGLLADLTVGAALAHVSRGARGLEAGSVTAASLTKQLDNQPDHVRSQVEAWLKTHLPPGGFPRQPLHWPLVFPEVFENGGGFDAIIGNPPFLGGKKISGALGSAYREHLVEVIGRGAKGNADLIAYFSLRAHGLLNRSGQTGLIGTNTLAQGDTREVGLDQLVENGVTIRQSIKSKPWPSKSAALEYCAVWTSREELGAGAKRFADDVEARGITPSLDPESRVTGNAERLAANAGISFIGSYVLGMGFTMEPGEAAMLIEKDTRNKKILFPYLNGQDLNSRSDCSASRWIINFHDWPIDQAREYADVYDLVEHDVRPERQRRKPDGSYVLRKPLPDRYWHYADKRPALYSTIAELGRVIAITLVSKTVMPVIVPTGQVFAHRLAVFATDDVAMFAALSSALHYWWAITYSSTLETRVNYAPSDAFETFPLPELTQEMRELGDRLDTFRRDVMLSRDMGLTKTYNLVFDPSCTDDDTNELRRIHRAIDEATIRAYGWEERMDAVGGLDHGFHQVGRETRYTIGPAAQREILDSLLELNHERYADEVARGLHEKKSARAKSQKTETLF